jgi:hypothetical protein
MLTSLDIGILVVVVSQLAMLLTARPVYRRNYVLSIAVFCSLGLLTLAVCFGQTPTENILAELLGGRRLQTRSDIAATVLAVGMGGFIGWSIGIVLLDARWNRLAAAACLYFMIAMSICLLASKDVLSKYLSNPASSGRSGLIVKEASSGWSIRKLADLSVNPTSMAMINENELLVSGYVGGYLQNGSIAKIRVTPEGVEQKIVANGMTRPHGVAFRDGKVYVSRAGQYSKAIGGRMVQMDTGCITELQDLDGDGFYEFADDVIEGLPGAQLPDGLHQNNNIVFLSDGKMLVTVGNPNDHGPPVGSIDGNILEVNLQNRSFEVFATGLRNPFGIAVTSEGRVYCTDNDSNDTNLGDRLIELRRGGNFGHPYRYTRGVNVTDVDPIVARLSSAQGIAFYPEGLDSEGGGKLIVASYGDDAINWVTLPGIGKQVTQPVKVDFLAKVPGPVAVCCSPTGLIYACSYREKALYEIRKIDNASLK